MHVTVIESATPSLASTRVKIGVDNSQLRYVTWTDINQLGIPTNYALIFNKQGKNLLALVIAEASYDLVITSGQESIFDISVLGGHFMKNDNLICTESLGNLKSTMGILLPGFVHWYKDKSLSPIL